MPLPKTIHWTIDPSILGMRDKTKKGRVLDFSSSFMNTVVAGNDMLFSSIEYHRLFDIMKRSITKHDACCYLTKDKSGGECYRMEVCFGSDSLTFIIRFNLRSQECFIMSISYTGISIG